MRNYAGEVDLICKKNNSIVFIEVKARKVYNGRFDEWMINDRQKNRIIRASQLFIAKHRKFSNCNVRFDIVIFSCNKFPSIIKNAWY